MRNELINESSNYNNNVHVVPVEYLQVRLNYWVTKLPIFPQ